MANIGEISWKLDKTTKLRKAHPEELQESFLQYFCSFFPEKEMVDHSKSFHSEHLRLAKEIANSKAVFEKIPLAAAFLEWVQEAHSKNIEEIEDAKFLLGNGFIGLKASDGVVWTLHHAALHDPNEIFEAIRCHREWSLVFRERLVLAYQNFILYLSSRTNEYIILRPDLERESVKNREISFREFIGFAEILKEKFQLIAKLLYFGGSRTVDEVMKLIISDIKFDDHIIRFGTLDVPYPLHVFADIKAVLGRRSKGEVFLGRQNALLNPATVFRNFKEAGIKAGLGSNFSPTYLTRNKQSA